MKKNKHRIKSKDHQIIIQMDNLVPLACRSYSTKNKVVNTSYFRVKY